MWLAGELCQDPADLDGDCKISKKDGKVLKRAMGGTISSYPDDGRYTSKADFNNDGKIDRDDYYAWREFVKDAKKNSH